jgi:hypothetical protein
VNLNNYLIVFHNTLFYLNISSYVPTGYSFFLCQLYLVLSVTVYINIQYFPVCFYLLVERWVWWLLCSIFCIPYAPDYVCWMESTWSINIGGIICWPSTDVTLHTLLPYIVSFRWITHLFASYFYLSFELLCLHRLFWARIWDLSLERDAEEEAELKSKMKEQAHGPDCPKICPHSYSLFIRYYCHIPSCSVLSFLHS